MGGSSLPLHNSFLQQAQNQFAYQQQAMAGIASLGSGYPTNGSLLQAHMHKISKPQEKNSMFKEVKNDLKAFMREHKSMIYWIVSLVILDRIYFKGAFEKKLAEMAHRFVALLETKIDKIAAGATDAKRDA